MLETLGCGCLIIVAAIVVAVVMGAYSLGNDAYHYVKKLIADETEVVPAKTINDSVRINISENKVVQSVDVQPIDNHFQVQEIGNYVDTMLIVSAEHDNEEIEAFELFFDAGKTELTEEESAAISELAKFFNEVNRPKMISLRQYLKQGGEVSLLEGKLDLVYAALCKAGVDEMLIQQDAPDQMEFSGNGKNFIQVNVFAK